MQEKEIYTNPAFLPPIEDFTYFVKQAYNKGTLTDHGILLEELETKLKQYLNVSDLQCVTSATVALQIAIKALGIESGEIITTPFSYVATTSAILAEKCTPVYADIEPDNFTIDANKIEKLITPKTKAIMPVHIFGYACNIEKISEIANKYHLKVIYDAAHAFGTKYKGKSILTYGDASIVSFQETKLFHTVEGGSITVQNKLVSEQIDLIKKCGHIGENHIRDGLNARLSELHAAMGLANLKYIDKNIQKRKELSEQYDKFLENIIQTPKKQTEIDYKYPYYVIVLKSEEQRKKIQEELNKKHIYTWHCYTPSLNTLKYLKSTQPCPIAEDIISRILMLPLYVELEKTDITRICNIILDTLY
jgi:dTDP-4-amino-4,6-dideoxygalactose transaminase